MSGTPFPIAPNDVAVSTFARAIFSDSYSWSGICYCGCPSFNFCAYTKKLVLIHDSKVRMPEGNNIHVIERCFLPNLYRDFIGLTMIVATNSFGFITWSPISTRLKICNIFFTLIFVALNVRKKHIK